MKKILVLYLLLIVCTSCALKREDIYGKYSFNDESNTQRNIIFNERGFLYLPDSIGVIPTAEGEWYLKGHTITLKSTRRYVTGNFVIEESTAKKGYIQILGNNAYLQNAGITINGANNYLVTNKKGMAFLPDSLKIQKIDIKWATVLNDFPGYLVKNKSSNAFIIHALEDGLQYFNNQNCKISKGCIILNGQTFIKEKNL